jgi:hypothetical protein
MGGACRAHGTHEKFYKIFVGKPRLKKSLERPWHIYFDLFACYIHTLIDANS